MPSTPRLTPVDYNPFASAAPSASGGPSLTPVDYNPFADPVPVAGLPFADTPPSGIVSAPEGDRFLGGSEVPRLDANGNLATVPTDREVRALQASLAQRTAQQPAVDPLLARAAAQTAPLPVLQDSSGLTQFGGLMGTAGYQGGLPTSPVIGGVADFNARFGPNAAAQYAGVDASPREQPTLREQLGATGNFSYPNGLGYLVDNPLTRGIAQGSNADLTGVSYITGDKAGVAGGLSRAPQLEIPSDAGFGSIAVQQFGNLVGSVVPALVAGIPTEGDSLAAPFVGQGLMAAAKTALTSPALRVAGTLGVTSAGNEAAQLDASGHPVSFGQFGTMAATNTAANLVPLAGRVSLPLRVASGALVGEGVNEATNIAAGRPVGSGAVLATGTGALLGALPGHHIPTLADEGQALAHQVAFGNRVDFLRDATARQDLNERMAQVAQQSGGVLHPAIAQQLAEAVANDHGTSVDALLRAPSSPSEAGAMAADQAIADAHQALSAMAPASLKDAGKAPVAAPDAATARVADALRKAGLGDTVDEILRNEAKPATAAPTQADAPIIQPEVLSAFAPREPALPPAPAGVLRDDLIQRLRAARTDNERAAAAANIAAFDISQKRQAAAAPAPDAAAPTTDVPKPQDQQAAPSVADVANSDQAQTANQSIPTPVIPDFPGLNAEQRVVEARARQQVLQDPAAALAAYKALPGTDNGRIISTDEGREIFTDYNAGPDARSRNAVAVHEPASAVAKLAYQDALAKPRSGENAFVLVTAGGTGAGKTTGMARVPSLAHLRDEADIVYDSNLQSEESSSHKIDQALATKRKVRIVYTLRDPIQGFVHGALPRAERPDYGRTVPIPAHVGTHVGSAETYLALKRRYASNPNVTFEAIHNDYVPGERSSVGPATDAQVQSIASLNRDTLSAEVHHALEQQRQDGNVSDRVYNGTLGIDATHDGSQPQGGAGRVGRSNEDGQGVALANRRGNDRRGLGPGHGIPVGEGEAPARSRPEFTQRQTGNQPEQIAPPDGGVSVSGSGKDLPIPPEFPAAPHDMTPDEIQAHADAVKNYGRQIEDSVLGDQADAWRRAQRAQDSSNHAVADKASATIDAIESKLTDPQKNALYGVGGKPEHFDDLADFRDVNSDAQVNSPDEAADVVGRLLPKLGNTKGQDPSGWTRDQQVAYAGMRAVRERIAAEGWDSKAIQKLALRRAAGRFYDANDAEFMLKRFLEPSAHKALAIDAPIHPDVRALTNDSKNSRGTTTGERVTHAPDQVRASATKAWGNRFVAKLERAGVLHFITTDEAVARGLAKSADELAGVKGLYQDGKAYVVTDQVRDMSDVPGIIVHEAGLHYGYDRLTTAADRQALRNRVNRGLAAGDPDVVKAWRHAEQVGTPAKNLHEEAMAYLAENAPGHGIVTRMLDAVKRGLNRAGVPIDMLESNTDAIRRMARDSLRRAANPEAASGHVHVDAEGVHDVRASTIGGAPVFSRYDRSNTPIHGGDPLTAGLGLIARHDEAFQVQASDAKTMEGVFHDAAPDIRIEQAPELAAQNEEGAQQAWRIIMPEGKSAKGAIYQKGNEVWIDVSDLEKGKGGSAVYSAVANYAHNTDRVFIGDPAGLSDVAMKRRTEQMLSSALKFGTTRHLAPHERQVMGDKRLGIEPLNFKHGQDAHNLTALARVAAANTLHEFPEIRDLTYNFDAGRFERPDGTEVTRADFERIASERRTEGERLARLGHAPERAIRAQFTAGGRSLERAVVTRSLIRGGGGEGPGLLAHTGVEQTLSPRLNKILYSRDLPGSDSTAILGGHREDRATHDPEAEVELPPRAPGESEAAWHARIVRTSRFSLLDGVRSFFGMPAHSPEALAMRDIGRGGLRAMWASSQRAQDKSAAAFRDAMHVFDKAGQTRNLQAIHQWETGQEVTSEAHRLFFKVMDKAFNARVERIRQVAPGALQDVIDHYFPHIWEDPTRAAKWYQSLAAKRPLEGNKSFLKQRVHDTIQDGMATGLKPISTNPVDLVLAKMAQMDKFIALHEFRQDLRGRGWLKEMAAGERVPFGYARVEDPAFVKAAGLQGYYAVPELIARDINNHLSPSLNRFRGFKAFRKVENLIMMARLGWSAFHAGFTTLDNVVMHADVAARYALQGDIKNSLVTLAKAPLSIAWSPIEGGKLNRQWLGLEKSDVHTAALLDALEQGGSRYKMSSSDYNSDLPKFIRSLRQRDYGTSLRTSLSALGETGSWLIHHKLVPNQKMAARMLLAKFELDRVAGQLGKASGDYAGIIEAMHPDALKQIMGKVVNVVDDRLGQMNYDNQFMNKTAREIAQTVIGAVGWQVGTLRTVTGGVHDLQRLWSPEKLLAPLDKEGRITDVHMGRVSGRLTYLLSLGLMMGSLSAITQYMLTGKGPEEPKDYFFPKTGRKNADGSDERLQFPTYWADHYKLATHPLETAEHKIHPIFGMFMEAMSNEDYYGVRIRDPNAPWHKQAEQVGEYLAKGFLPYSVTNNLKVSQNKDSPLRHLASFIGVTNAPASVSRSEFQAFVAHNGSRGYDSSMRTPAQAERTQAMHDAETAIRQGEQPDISAFPLRDQRTIRQMARKEVPELRFGKMSIQDKLRAYDMATPAERDKYHLRELLLRNDPRHSVAFQTADPDEQAAIMKRLSEIYHQQIERTHQPQDQRGGLMGAMKTTGTPR